ncbi:hypothetical protein ACFFGR_16975 [Arthrobacter liuii]|nr:hypothetical protein [Arthrobacter liuii]
MGDPSGGGIGITERDIGSPVDWVGAARQAVRTSMANGEPMKYSPYLAAVAVLVGVALVGCQPAVGPPAMGLSASVPGPPSSELAAIIQTAVEDRNGPVLDTPPAARLAAAQMTAAYGSKREQDLPW